MNEPRETVTGQQMSQSLARHIASKLTKDDLISLAIMLDNDVGDDFHHWIQVECQKVAPELYVESDNMVDGKLKVPSLIDVGPMSHIEEMANRHWPTSDFSNLDDLEKSIAAVTESSEQLQQAETALGLTLAALDSIQNLPPTLPPELLLKVEAAGRRLMQSHAVHCGKMYCSSADDCRCSCDPCAVLYAITHPPTQPERMLLIAYLKDIRERKAKEQL